MNESLKEFSKEPYDISFWDINQIELIVIPWLPFFSSCENYGRKIVLYDLLENNKNCTNSLKKPEDTKVVE